MSQWFLVQTHSNAERSARDALQAPYRGCTAYLPEMLTVTLHARRRVEKPVPFLPRYLFVKDEGQGVPVVRTAPGVSSLAYVGGRPIMVDQKIVDQIRIREKLGAYLDRKGERCEGMFVDLAPQFEPYNVDKFSPGEQIRVTGGAFASFDAVFQQWTPKMRAEVAVSIFGRLSNVVLDHDQFEKV